MTGTTIESLPLTSLNLAEHQRQKLKELFPEVFTEGSKVDWDKLRLTLGEMVDTGKERFGMNWPGKADCFKTIQQPSVATLVPAREESVDFDTTENLFIEGDNLEVLKLLQKSYLGKVKMIYIDPPYNTGNDFIYPDNYSENLETYLEYTGQVDGEGRKFSTNTDTDGRFHSKWMNMMYPRLFLAKNMLRDDGVIFISIDDSEVANLRKLCDEIFGEENFIANFVWQSKDTPGNDSSGVAQTHNHIISFRKSANFIPKLLDRNEEQLANYKNPDNDPRGVWLAAPLTRSEYRERDYYPIKNPVGKDIFPPSGTCWRRPQSVLAQLLSDNRVWWGKSGESTFPMEKKFLSEAKDGVVSQTWWPYEFAGSTRNANAELKNLFTGDKPFDTPKPTRLIQRMIQIACNQHDIVLDFFAGSATTAHAVLDLNKEDSGKRKYICVQLPEPIDEKAEAFKSGYNTIAEISKERIRRASAKIKAEVKSSSDLLTENNVPLDCGFRVFKLQKSNFHVWDASVSKEPEAIQQALELHVENIDPKAKEEAILFELLLKSGFELTTPIEVVNLAGKIVYSVSGGGLLICLEKQLTHELIKAMAELEPSRVVCLDEGFQNNDQLKTNAVLIMKSKGVVDFRTV